MLLSPYSFFASFIAVIFLTLILWLFLKNDRLISRIGLNCIYLFALLILLRGLIPVEFSFSPFPLTRTIYSGKVLPAFRDMLLSPFYETKFLSLTPAMVLYGVCLTGSMIVFGIKVYRYRKCRRIASLLPKVSDPTVIAAFQSARECVLSKRTVSFRLLQTDRIPTPALLGFRHPLILLPDIDYTEEELYCVFLHELIHYKRRYFLVKFLLDLLTVIQWWNPVLIFCLLPAVQQIQELSIDAQLSRAATQSQKVAYLTSLSKTLHSVREKRRFPPNMGFMLLSGQKESTILQRFRYIKAAPQGWGSKLGPVFCFLLFILSFSFVFETSYSIETDESGKEMFRDSMEETFYVRNGDMYDLYIDNQYVYTSMEILDTFKDIPIYNQTKEEQVS